MTHVISRLSYGIAALSLVVSLLLLVTSPARALSDSSLLLSDPRSSQTGVTYTFTSAGFSGTTLRCIQLQLDTQSDGAGSAVGTTTGASLSSSTLITAGSWTPDFSTNGMLELTNAGGEVPSASGDIVFGGITNGATEGTTYFGIFTTFSDAGCTTSVDTTIVSYLFTDGELVQLTIDPTLTFAVNTVATSQAVNGATTTIGSTPSGINHGNSVTQAANGISAHDLQVGTNAPGGYSVYIRHTGLLQNGATDTIANHTGTNAAPTAFPAAGTEAWGYTTEDGTLTTGTADRFTNGGPFWAGFTTSNEVVVDNPGALSGTETTRVGHQVGVSATTPAGTYQTTIIYTVASTY